MGGNKNKKEAEEVLTLNKKDQKKVDKLTSMIPYHEGRKNQVDADKCKEQIAAIWANAKEVQGF